jgi:hypothetical protein
MHNTNFIIAVLAFNLGCQKRCPKLILSLLFGFQSGVSKRCPKLILSLLFGFQSGVSKIMPKTNFIIAVWLSIWGVKNDAQN